MIMEVTDTRMVIIIALLIVSLIYIVVHAMIVVKLLGKVVYISM